ncbi:MAG: hypothetical protein JRH11_11015 [Deltaproteobacteria bacterium]|nr:hypothetical protein [Deltaproteobacteria bacterium]
MGWVEIVRVIHLLGAAIWTGGQIVLAALVFTLLRAGTDREHIRAAARRFAQLSWGAMGVSIATGILQVHLMGYPWSYGRLQIKIGVVTVAAVMAAVHQLTATRTPPRIRGISELALLLVSVGIFVAAVAI